MTGPAEAFCLLVVQRRHRSQTTLSATGAVADRWLDVAQATTFLAAVPFALLGFLVLLFLRETPLRRHAQEHTTGENLAEAFETAVDPDSDLGHGADDDAVPTTSHGRGAAGARRPKGQP